MKKILIDPHYCSREEYKELKEYLKKNCWDYKEVKEEIVKTSKHYLGDNEIDNTKINTDIFQEEMHEYRIVDRETEIDNLCRWIAECKNSDKVLMLQDLEKLMGMDDEYLFSSGNTNDYVGKEDADFDKICDELLELNKTIK